MLLEGPFYMTTRKRTSQHLVIMMMTATLLTSVHHIVPSGNSRTPRRLLAYSTQTHPGLYTIELRNDTAISNIYLLQAGTTVRLAGVLKGHTISATRIDVLIHDKMGQ